MSTGKLDHGASDAGMMMGSVVTPGTVKQVKGVELVL